MWNSQYLDDGIPLGDWLADTMERYHAERERIEALNRAERARIADDMAKLPDAINEADDDE